MNSQKLRRIVFIIPIVVFLLFISFHIDRYPADDTTPNVTIATTYAFDGVFKYYGEELIFSPPLYLYLLGLCIRLFGLSAISTALPGVLCIFLTGLLGFLFCKKFNFSTKQTFLYTLLFFLSPLMIQSSIVRDIDTGLLMLTTNLFLFCFLLYDEKKSFLRWNLLSVVFAICLWSKLTTPFLLVPSVLFFSVLTKPRNIKQHCYLLGCFAVGFLFFCITFYSWSVWTGVSWYLPIEHLKRGADTFSLATFEMRTIFKRSFYSTAFLTVWLTPFFIIAVVLAFLRRISFFLENHDFAKIDILYIWGFITITTYTVVLGGVFNGFPKYYIPGVFPLFLILPSAGKNVLPESRKKNLFLILICIFFLIVFFTYLGDPIKWIQFDLKKYLIGSIYSGKNFTHVISQFLIYFSVLPFSIIFVTLSTGWSDLMQKIYVCALALSIAGFVALNFQQAFAGYNAGYAYGSKGSKSVVNYIEKKYSANEVVALERILFWSVENSRYVSNGLWNSHTNFLKKIKDPETKLIILSLGTHSVGQFRNTFHHSKIKKYLKEKYHRKIIGTYTLWERNGHNKR